MKARRLDTRSILPFWDQENASTSQGWKTLAELFNDCSSLSVPETPSWLDSWRNLWDLKPENEGGNLFPFDAAIDERVEPQLLWCRKLPIFAFSHFFIWILQERVIVALLRGLHRSRWGKSILLWPVTLAISERTMFAFFILLTVVFLALWFVNFFLTYFKASTSYGLLSLCYLWYFRLLV